MVFTLLSTGIAFLVGRWKLRKNLDNGFKKLRQMVTGLETIASRPTLKSESDESPSNDFEGESETDNSLKNILIEEDHSETDSKTTPKNRHRI
jgi:hypothetical protein